MKTTLSLVMLATVLLIASCGTTKVPKIVEPFQLEGTNWEAKVFNSGSMNYVRLKFSPNSDGCTFVQEGEVTVGHNLYSLTYKQDGLKTLIYYPMYFADKPVFEVTIEGANKIGIQKMRNFSNSDADKIPPIPVYMTR